MKHGIWHTYLLYRSDDIVKKDWGKALRRDGRQVVIFQSRTGVATGLAWRVTFVSKRWREVDIAQNGGKGKVGLCRGLEAFSQSTMGSCERRLGKGAFLRVKGESLALSVNPLQFVGELL